MNLVEDPWLSNQIQLPVFKLDGDDFFSSQLFQEKLETYPHVFCYTKVPVTSTTQISKLTDCGFHVVDVNLLFSYQYNETGLRSMDSSHVKIENCNQSDEDELLCIAESNFIYSRFHLDPNISKQTADKVKRNWVENNCSGKRGDRLLVAKINEKPVGFLAVIISKWANQTCAIIDLIGVDSSIQGKGIGTALVSFFQNEYGKRYPNLLVGTQAANIPSVRLYEKCGFRLCESKYVLHYHK